MQVQSQCMAEVMGWHLIAKESTHRRRQLSSRRRPALSHLNLRYVKFDQLDCLVLDEADKMLDMGFYDDILRIIRHLPAQRQNLFFSNHASQNAGPCKKNSQRSEGSQHRDQQTCGRNFTGHTSLLIHKNSSAHKDSFGKRSCKRSYFCFTKSGAKALERELQLKKLPAKSIHSDLSQEERENVLLSFKSRLTKFLSRQTSFPVELILTTSDLSLITMCHQMQKIMYTVSAEQPEQNLQGKRLLLSMKRSAQVAQIDS